MKKCKVCGKSHNSKWEKDFCNDGYCTVCEDCAYDYINAGYYNLTYKDIFVSDYEDYNVDIDTFIQMIERGEVY